MLPIAASVQGTVAENELRIAVFNPLAIPLEQPVDVTLEIPVEWPTYHEMEVFEPRPAFRIFTHAGAELPYQFLGQTPNRKRFRTYSNGFPRGYSVHEVRVSIPLRIPALGYTTLTVRAGEKDIPTRHPATPGLAASERSLENEFLALTVESNGSLTVLDKRSGQTFTRWLTFENCADIGDGWNFGPASNDRRFTSAASSASVALAFDGPHMAALRIRTVMEMPAAFDFASNARQEHFERLVIDSTVTLRAGQPRLEVETTVFNTLRDHRLRVLFPSCADGAQTYLADSPFDVVERPIALRAGNHLYREPEIEMKPQQTWTAVYDQQRGLAVLSTGLLESAVIDHPGRTLALTLFAEPKVLQRSERGRFRDFHRIHAGGSAVYQLRSRLGPDLESRASAGADEACQDGSVLFYDLAPDGGRGTTLLADSREAANSAGGFVQEEVIWRGRWSLRAALRYDDLWYISEDHMDPTLDATKHFTRFTPKGSLAYLGGAYTVYAALGGGVEAPAFNEVDPPPEVPGTSLNPFIEPMRSTAWELGAKGEAALPGRLGRLRYDAALYWIAVANDIVPWDGGTYFFTAGRTRRRGAELGCDWLAGERLVVSASGTLSGNEYLEYRNDLGDFSGARVPGLPRGTFHATARWLAAAGLVAEVSAEHRGGYYADDANTAWAGACTLLGASLGYSWTLGTRTARAFVAGHNLADEDHVASVFINGVSGQFYEPGLPRSWSAGLTLTGRVSPR